MVFPFGAVLLQVPGVRFSNRNHDKGNYEVYGFSLACVGVHRVVKGWSCYGSSSSKDENFSDRSRRRGGHILALCQLLSDGAELGGELIMKIYEKTAPNSKLHKLAGYAVAAYTISSTLPFPGQYESCFKSSEDFWRAVKDSHAKVHDERGKREGSDEDNDDHTMMIMTVTESRDDDAITISITSS